MKITKRQLRRIIREEKAKLIKENYDERKSDFFADGEREQNASDILEFIIRALQVKFPDQAKFDELAEDISDFLYAYEQQIKTNKGTYL